MTRFELHPDELDRRRRFGLSSDDPTLRFYGGAPGLNVGDPILPRLGLPEIPLPTQTTVRLRSTLFEAHWDAAGWFGGGDLYLAEPLGDLVHNCFDESRHRAAKVVGVIKRDCQWEELTDAPRRFPNPPLFHGGVPGLKPGDRLLPPLWTGEPGDCDGKGWSVWLTASVEEAWSFAHRVRGDVYQAHPEGSIRLDGNGVTPAVPAEAAVVVAVVARDVARPVPTTTDPRPPDLRASMAGLGPFALKMGAVFPGEVEPTEDQWRRAWQGHREALIAEYREWRPGERPPPFWWFEAPDAPTGRVAGTPKTLSAGLRWLLANGHITRLEAAAIVDAERWTDRPGERAKAAAMVRGAR
jgi:hypothetical protein